MGDNKKTVGKSLPLGKLEVEIKNSKGVIIKKPALHADWAPRKFTSHYVPLMLTNGRMKEGADLDEWSYNAQKFKNEMMFLLQRKHNVFWSYILYNKSANTTLIEFLDNITPFYILTKWDERLLHDERVNFYKSLLSLVLRIIFRFLTESESNTEWMESEYLGNLLYDNYILTGPMLLDVIIGLGTKSYTHATLLTNLFKDLFRIQSKYIFDMQECLAFFDTACANIVDQVTNDCWDGACGGAPLDDTNETVYDDVTFFTLDTAYTLNSLLEACPQLIAGGLKIHIPQNITVFYENIMPLLYTNIYTINPNAMALNWLNIARLQFLNVFRTFCGYFIEETLNKPNIQCANQFIDLLMECMAAQTFILDYQRQYPIENEIDILQQVCPDLKGHRIDFLVNGYQTAVSSDAFGTLGDLWAFQKRQEQKEKQQVQQQQNNAKCVGTKPKQKMSSPKSTKKKLKAYAEAQNISTPQRDLDSEISAVLELFPDMGSGFVRRLLLRYDNYEQTITAILDENLPPDLAVADRTEPYIPPDPQDRLYHETGIKHFNIYDGDPYDVMTQDEPKCIIKRGKGFPNDPKNAGELLDDKAFVTKLKDRFTKLSLVEESNDDITTNEKKSNEYQDEFDDSYDAMVDGQPETELRRRARLKTNFVDADDDDLRDDASDEVRVNNSGNKRRDDFCENPEVTRARYEARQQAKYGYKKTNAQPNRDVVGAPKGQGQTQNTQRNRNKKGVNKSTRANHNRKDGAAYKRSKGMMP